METTEVPKAAEAQGLNAETVTPLWEVILDLGERCHFEGLDAAAELIFRAAELAKGIR